MKIRKVLIVAEEIADGEIPECDNIGNKISELTEADMVEWMDMDDFDTAVKKTQQLKSEILKKYAKKEEKQ